MSDLGMSDSNGLCIPSVCTDGSLVSHPSLTSDLRTRNLFSSQDITEWPIESNAQTSGVLKIFCNMCIMSVVTNVTPWVRITLVGRLHGGNRLYREDLHAFFSICLWEAIRTDVEKKIKPLKKILKLCVFV